MRTPRRPAQSDSMVNLERENIDSLDINDSDVAARIATAPSSLEALETIGTLLPASLTSDPTRVWALRLAAGHHAIAHRAQTRPIADPALTDRNTNVDS